MRCVLIGNYGAGNAGDEALRSAMLAMLPDIEWQVMSARPTPVELPRLPSGVRSFFGFRWGKTLRAIYAADAVVFGGGSLFTDVESVWACVLWWLHARAAVLFGKPVYLAFQGIGPFRTRMGEWFARDVVRRSAFLSVRDSASMGRVESWKLNKKIVQSFDPVIEQFAKSDDESSNKLLIVIPRWNSTQEFIDAARRAAHDRQGIAVRIVLMQPDHPGDRAAGAFLAGELKGDVVETRSLPELHAAVRDASLVVTQRYHGAIAALGLEKNCVIIPQHEGDKLSELQPLLSLSPRERLEQLRSLVRTGEEALREALIAKH